MKALLEEKAGMLGRIGIAAIGIAVALACANSRASASVHNAPSFIVDGVHVTVSGGEVRGAVFAGEPGDATQEATIVDRASHRTVSVIAVPFGTRPGSEDLPLAHRGGAREYADALHAYRARTGEFANDGPVVKMFGAHVEGDLSQFSEHTVLTNGREVDREVFTVEWVTEAGARLWIMRAREFAPPNHPLITVADFVSSLAGLTLSADGSLNVPTTVTPDILSGAVPGATFAPSGDAGLGVPPAYSSACDAANYDRITGRSDWRHALGATFRGVPACGPRPGTIAPLMAASFSQGTPPAVFQFDAVELSLRWMFLAFNTPPFLTTGDELFDNYSVAAGGRPLYKYANAHGAAPPQPGDVLSYDTGGTLGHTSVVEATHLDSHGNGSIDVIEQGESAHGIARLTVIDGQVFSNYGGYVKGWLSPRPSA